MTYQSFGNDWVQDASRTHPLPTTHANIILNGYLFNTMYSYLVNLLLVYSKPSAMQNSSCDFLGLYMDGIG